jgi:TPR repeat protein
MVRVEANDPTSICLLATHYHLGRAGFQQDHTKAIELYAKAADLGYSQAHYCLGNIYKDGGDLKKAKSHYEAAAMAGHEVARCIVGVMEDNSGNAERAIKHWVIAASAGESYAMHNLKICFEKGLVSSKSINLTLAAYNNSCVERRSEASDASIRNMM